MFVLLLTLSIPLIVGCSSNNKTGGEEKIDKQQEQTRDNSETTTKEVWAYDGDPVTLKMLIWIDEETFRIRYKEQVEAEFPNITLELISGGDGSEQLQELFAKGEMPDIHIGRPTKELVENLDFLEPIEEYIEKKNFDLGIYQGNIIKNLRSVDPLGKEYLYGLPIENSVRTMFYNKEIFDKFGLPYPEDGMTWDEVLDLAKRLTVERDGVQYRGLAIDPTSVPFMQLGVQGTDSETGEILFADNPDTKKFFDLLDQYRTIPGLVNTGDELDGFHDGPQNIAMSVLNAPWFELLLRVDGFDFDMVTVPTWEDNPDNAPTYGALSLNITKHSEHKDAAWSVIAYLASEKGQTELSRAGSPPTINNEAAIEQFTAMGTDGLDQTYNTKAPFIQTLAELAPYSKYDEPFIEFVGTKATEFLASDKDAVTYIREMGEEYRVIVEELKSQE